jgi:hypothetical protein
VVLLLAVAVLNWTGAAEAQVTTGSVGGTIRDAQGAAVPGATIVLISERRNTRLAPVVTGTSGDFAVPNVSPDTYTVEVTMPSFKMLSRKGVSVSAGERVALGTMTLEVGGVAETVDVTADAPLLQAQSGERSYIVTTTQVENLPLSNRNFAALASLSPGVNGTNRAGGGGQTNYVMDGISVVDTGNNSQMLQLNVDAIAEVKVLTSNYQAEYGRSSGLQITAVTKSGSNRFRGSVYDVKRNSDWNENSWANKQNGEPKTPLKQDDWGYTIGGPVGKPGGGNKLFFFVATEYRPRTGGGNIARFRVPTDPERQGDFSQTRDNTGNLFPFIRDHRLGSAACTATATATCFSAGGTIGRIPQGDLYAPGLAILNMFPRANHTQAVGENYNYEVTAPVTKTYTYQPSVRMDYQFSPQLRFSAKFNGQNNAPGRPVNPGSMPGFNDTQRIQGTEWTSTWAVTGNYSLSPTMFIEGTYGRARNYGTTVIVSPTSNINNVGLQSLPLLYPDARTIDPAYYGYQALSQSDAPWFQDGQILLPPNFAWGTRIGCAATNNNAVAAPCPPNLNYPNALNTNPTYDISLSLTKVTGRHTIRAGYYHNHSLKAQNINLALGALPFKGEMNFSNDTNNPLDSQFGYANAALGIVSTYFQQSKFVEGYYVYNNREWFIQDNWRVNKLLTLDFGLRFVNQQPQHDAYGHSSNFFPEQWSQANAPFLYLPACPAGVSAPCPTTRQAMHPVTRQLLGPGTAINIGQIVPGTGNPTQGLIQQGQQGISEYGYVWPVVGYAPRFGAAYDVKGNQKIVLRGGGGVFFDRPPSDSVQNLVSNPPFSRGVTLRGIRLQDLAAAQGGPTPATQIFAYQYSDGLPSSFQWNGGVQVQLPFASALDVSYVGQHAWNQQNATGAGANGQNLNTVDLGAAFLPQNQDPTLAATTNGSSALTADLLRGYRGYGNINQQQGNYWRTYHSIQTAVNRRFTHGLQAGINWTWAIMDNGTTSLQPRYQHAADGTVSLRDDWEEFVDQNKNQGATTHIIKANWVWDLPDLDNANSTAKRVVAAVLNDWQLSGVFTADTGSKYSVTFSYQSGGSNVNLTGSPDFPAKVRIVGDTSGGCSSNQYKQFETSAFAGPVAPSLGLESGRNYLTGCGDHTTDLALARNFRLGGARTAQVRIDAFNAFNTVIFTGRVTNMQLTSQANQTLVNSQYLPDGTLDPNRVLPRNAGFGGVTGASAARSVQLQLRFSF